MYDTTVHIDGVDVGNACPEVEACLVLGVFRGDPVGANALNAMPEGGDLVVVTWRADATTCSSFGLEEGDEVSDGTF